MNEIKVTVFKRGAVYYMQYRDELGTTIQKSTKEKKKAAAIKVAGKWETKLKEGADWSSGRMAWQTFRDRFETEHLSGLAPKTEKKYIGVLNVFERLAKPAKLASINAKRLSIYQVALRDQGKEETTIKSHLTHLKSALNWAKSQKLIDRVPAFPTIQRAKKTKKTTPMKGRAITTEEFERMIAAVGKVIVVPNKGKAKARIERGPDETRLASWQHLIKGLWVSGLRLGESLDLHWDDETKIRPDGKFFRVPCESEKGHQDRILPMSPECFEFLESVPKSHRNGYVFSPIGQNKDLRRLTVQTVGRTIALIGERAGIKVNTKRAKDAGGKPSTKPVFASAHDLRRSFGERWAARIMPPQLMELMRHESIETTLRFYVGQNAQKTSAILWEAHKESKAEPMAPNSQSADNSANTYEKRQSPNLETAVFPKE